MSLYQQSIHQDILRVEGRLHFVGVMVVMAAVVSARAPYIVLSLKRVMTIGGVALSCHTVCGVGSVLVEFVCMYVCVSPTFIGYWITLSGGVTSRHWT